MLYEYDFEDEPSESDAHPPLEPVDKHSIVCAGCGDVLVEDCGCGIGIGDHETDGELCRECRDEALSAY
jgi:hypothetical protein